MITMFARIEVKSISTILTCVGILRDPLAPTKAEIQLELADVETARDALVGSAAWLSFGLELEEEQYVITNTTKWTTHR